MITTLTAITWRIATESTTVYNTSRQRVEEKATRPRPSPPRWNTSYLDEGVFREALHRERNLLSLDGDKLVAVLKAADAARTICRRAKRTANGVSRCKSHAEDPDKGKQKGLLQGSLSEYQY